MGYLFCLDIGSLIHPKYLLTVSEVSVNWDQIFIPQEYAFYQIRKLTMGATVASMVAYLTAQFIDVHIFHFLKAKQMEKLG